LGHTRLQWVDSGDPNKFDLGLTLLDWTGNPVN